MPVYILVAGIMILAAWNWKNAWRERKRYYCISAAWFILTFLIGFFYSRYVNAVLQFSVLIFSFPWLLFLLTGMLPDLKGWRRPALVSLVTLAMFFTLMLQRQYYGLFYHNRFRELVIETNRTLEEYGSERCLAVMDSHQKISDHYYEKLGIHFDHVHYDELAGPRAFIDLLKTSDKEILSLACDSESALLLPNIARTYFPRMLKKMDYYGGNYYVFSRDSTHQDELYFSFLNDFAGSAKYWSAGTASSYLDTIGFRDSTSYFMTGGQEFGPLFSRKLRSILIHRNDLVDISVAVQDLDSLNSALLVAVLRDGNKQVSWTASHFNRYKPRNEGWYRVYHTFRPTVTGDLRGLDIEVYVWNKDGNTFLIDDFRIDSRPGNRVLYGLLEKI